MSSNDSEQSLELMSVERQPLEAHVEQVTLRTSGGNINAVLHLARAGTRGGIVWVGGAGGGLYGPAGGLYPRLSKQLVVEGITSLRLDYRAPTVSARSLTLASHSISAGNVSRHSLEQCGVFDEFGYKYFKIVYG